jgi:hypothetical protein
MVNQPKQSQDTSHMIATRLCLDHPPRSSPLPACLQQQCLFSRTIQLHSISIMSIQRVWKHLLLSAVKMAYNLTDECRYPNKIPTNQKPISLGSRIRWSNDFTNLLNARAKTNHPKWSVPLAMYKVINNAAS